MIAQRRGRVGDVCPPPRPDPPAPLRKQNITFLPRDCMVCAHITRYSVCGPLILVEISQAMIIQDVCIYIKRAYIRIYEHQGAVMLTVGINSLFS